MLDTKMIDIVINETENLINSNLSFFTNFITKSNDLFANIHTRLNYLDTLSSKMSKIERILKRKDYGTLKGAVEDRISRLRKLFLSSYQVLLNDIAQVQEDHRVLKARQDNLHNNLIKLITKNTLNNIKRFKLLEEKITQLQKEKGFHVEVDSRIFRDMKEDLLNLSHRLNLCEQRKEYPEMKFSNNRSRTGSNWTTAEDVKLRQAFSLFLDEQAKLHERGSMSLWYRIKQIVYNNEEPN
jgi:hypothetical protein